MRNFIFFAAIKIGNARFIAVNDSADYAAEDSNDFTPIRGRANELHAMDTSRKVRSVMKIKVEQGERQGGRPPCCYRGPDTTRPCLWSVGSVTVILNNEDSLTHGARFDRQLNGLALCLFQRLLTGQLVVVHQLFVCAADLGNGRADGIGAAEVLRS